MDHDNAQQPRDQADPRRRVIARLTTIATTATVAAIGPGLALAEAAMTRNHNEVMASRRT
jgi:hypothetical protein